MTAPALRTSSIQFLIKGLKKWPVLRIGQVGTFIRKEQPARWDPEKNVIFPPAIVLDFVKGFESQFSFLDYLLNEEQMSEDEGTAMAQQLQEMIVEGLSENRTFRLEGLGKITKTESGEFSFYTDESVIQDLDDHSFGLLAVKATRKDPLGIHPATTKDNPISMNVPTGNSPSQGRRFLGWKFFLVLALLLALGGLTVQYGPWDINLNPFSSQPDYSAATEEQLPDSATPSSQQAGESVIAVSSDSDISSSPSDGIAAPEETETEDPETPSVEESSQDPAELSQRRGPLPAESQPLDQTIRDAGNQIASAETDQPVGDMGIFRGGGSEEVSRVLAPIRYYHLIAGSFNNASRAQEFVSQMKEEGYDAFVLFPQEGSGEPHRVSIYRDGDRQKVSSYADKLKQMGRQAGWVYAERSFEE